MPGTTSVLLKLGLVDRQHLIASCELIFLGKIIAPLVMGIIFFFVVTPIAIFMRLLKKDLLNLKYNHNKSYWIKKNEIKSKMKNQF